MHSQKGRKMERLKSNKKLKRISAFILAVVLVLASIPVNGFITSSVKADEAVTANGSDFVIKVNSILGPNEGSTEQNPANEISPLAGADVTITATITVTTTTTDNSENAGGSIGTGTGENQGDNTGSQNSGNAQNDSNQTPVITTAEKTVTVTGKTDNNGQYIVSENDLKKLKGEVVEADSSTGAGSTADSSTEGSGNTTSTVTGTNTSGKVTVNTSKDGYKFESQEVELSRIGSAGNTQEADSTQDKINAGNPFIINGTPDCFGAAITAKSDLKYTGEAQELIEPVTINNIEETDTGNKTNDGNAIYSATTYKTEYSTTSATEGYLADIPKGTDAKVYPVYIKVTKTVETYTKTDNSENTQQQENAAEGSNSGDTTVTKTVQSSTTAESVKKVLVTIGKDTDTFTLDFYKENETEKADLTSGINVTWGDSVTYTAKSEKAPAAVINYDVKAEGITASERSEASSPISEEITIDNNGKVTTTKKAAGKSYKVIVTMTSINDSSYTDSNYQLPVAEYTIHVNAKSETGYAFEHGDESITYVDNYLYTNTYKYTGDDAGQSKPDGLSVTEYKITKQYDADGKELDISGSDDVNSENTADDDVSSTATGSDNTSASQSPVAVIEENNKTTGTLTIKRAGKVVVEAVISDEDKAAYGLTANPSYTLTIERAEAEIIFTAADQTIQFGETPAVKEAAINNDKYDKNANNTITYSIQSTGTPFITDDTSDSEGSESENTKPIATIDAATGIVTVNGVGTITVTATMPATDRYKEATAAYTITVGQAEVSLVYNELSKELKYAINYADYNQDVVIKDKKGNEITDATVLNYINKNIAYSADAAYDTKGFASDAVDSSTGYVKLPAGEGQIRVIAALQNNPFYKYKDGTSQASYELKQIIMTQPEDKVDSEYYSTEVTGTEGTSAPITQNEAGWYNKDNIVLKAKHGYKIAKESKETDIAAYAADDTTNSSEVTAGNLIFKDSVTISKSDLNSNRQIQLYYLEESSGNIIKSKVQNFKIDDTEPEINIEYVKETFYQQVIETLKSLISGNTNNQSSAGNKRVVAIKITAKDTDSDINPDSIKAVLNDGSSDVELTPNEYVKVQDDENNVYYRTFTIPSEQRGNIKYSAANKAGLTATKTDNVYTVIADDTAPVIEDEIVKYKGDTSSSTEYKKTLNIKVTEKNFDNRSDFVMTIKKKASSNAEEVESTVNGDSLKWTYDSSNIALYSTSYDFTEDGIYEVSYSYKDPSENQAVVKDSSATIGEYVQKFIVDTTAPKVDIALKDGEQSINAGNYATSTDGVTAEITVTEAIGFDVNGIDVTLTADKLQGVDTVQVYDNGTGQYKDTTISALTSLLNSSSGSTQGSNNYWRQDEKDSTKYKAVIKLVSDAKYEIKAAAKDKYNNDGGSKTASVIYDKTVPSGLKAEMTPAGTQGDNKYGDVIFYDNGTKSVTISLSADDKVSEIDHFEYWEEGLDAKHTVNADNNGEYNIVISSDYNKSITYKAVDKAGNVSEKATAPKIIIDSKAPVLNVDYVKTQQSEVTSDSYSDNVNMNITLTEDNYYNDGNESFVIDAKYTPYGKNQTANNISADMKNAINMQKNSSGAYTGSYQFTQEGKYDISIKYVDKAGNESQISKKTFEIDKARPEVSIELQDENGNAISTYTKDDVYAVVTVKEKVQFNKDKVEFNYSGKDIDGNNLHPAPEVIGTEWESSTVDGESIYTNKYKFSTEAVYNFDVTYTGVSGLVSDKKEAVTTYDKTAPADLSIKYNTTEKTVNEGNRYFDTNDIKVTLSASDDISGIKSFEYSTDGSEWITKNVTELSKKNNNKLYEAVITLPDEYSGTIKFKAMDKAGNEVQQVTDNVVKDTINPVIKAGFTDSDNNRITLDTGKLTYVNKDITADIAITEKNFNADKTTVTISKTNTKDNNNYPDSTEIINGDEFTLENGKHIKSITFDKEYEYTITVKTTDYSGNSASYTGKFVLDKTNPEVTVDFNNDSARNDKYAEWYQGDRKATITVNDHNFNKDGMSIVVTETNGIQNKKAENYYLNQWKENVKDSGDYHTGNITFDNEAEYSIAVVYTDLAGNKNTVAVYKNGEKSEQLTSKIFAIDKTDPVIKVNYTQNNGKEPVSGDHYTSNVTASIQITEHNFKPEDVKNCFNMTVKYQPYQGVQTDITKKIKNSLDFTNKEGTDEWNTSFELRQGEADDNIDGIYTISYSYIDQSGRRVEIPEKVFYIDKTDPGVEINLTDTDGKQLTGEVYSQKEIISEIVIDENAAFNPSNVKTELKSSDDTGNTVDNVQLQVYISDTDEWKKLDSLDKLKDYWKNDGRKHTVKVKYITEAGYVLSVVYKNDSDRDDNKEKSFNYDKTMPGGLSITYNQTPKNNAQGYKFFDEESVTVTLTARDTISGISCFRYTKDNGNTWETINVTDLKTETKDKEKIYSYSFDIKAQYKNIIKFEAVDKADNKDSISDSVVDDTVVPVVKVDYAYAGSILGTKAIDNTVYYIDKDTAADITITEANLYPENVNVEITGSKNGVQSVSKSYTGDDFVYENGVYKLKNVKFDEELDYTFDITVKDYSKHQVSYGRKFVVDKTNPAVTVDFGGDSYKNSDYPEWYGNDRKAVITVKEHNFDKNGMSIIVTEKNGKDSKTVDYTQKWKDAVKSDGDTHTAAIDFTNEAEYEVKVVYTDLAGNKNTSSVYKNGDKTEDKVSKTFAIDKTKPELEVTYAQDKNETLGSDIHYAADVTMSVDITEHNYTKDGFLVEVYYTPYLGQAQNKSQEVTEGLSFKKTENTDNYNAAYKFSNDGYYSVKIIYTDKAGYKSTERSYSFYIDKTNPSIEVNLMDTDGNSISDASYTQKEVIAEIIVTEDAEFNADNVTTALNTTDNTDKSFIADMQVYNPSTGAYEKLSTLNNLKNYWDNSGVKHTVKVKYITEGKYSFGASYINSTKRESGTKTKTFTYDKTAAYDMSITYDQTPENTTHGYKFYNENDVNVTLTAKDRVSGIDYFRYSKDNGNTWNSVQLSDIKIDKSGDEKVYTYGFKIDAQYKDTIRFEAVDKAKNTNETADSIIVDTEKPVITVQYINDTQPGVYDNHTYYQSTRQARVYITENNFYDENMYVEVNGVLNDGTVKNYAKYNGSGFELVNGTNNLWQSKELIDMSDDADYALYVAARDYSNNIADNRYEDFTVDTINPDISIDFHGDTSAIASNADQFKNNRTATVTFTEHNFNADDINVLVTENGNDVSAQYKQALLSTLNTLGDVYQGSITFSNEMNYTFAISYTDKAGRGNNDIVYANGSMTADLARITSNRFTVDKTAPQIGMTMSGKIADEEEAWSRQWNNETGADGFYQAPDGGVNFGLWSRDNVNVNITDNDNLSGIEKTGYYITSSAVTGTAQLAGLADDAWTDFADVSGGQVTLTPNSKSIVYVRVIDRAGNISYMSSSGVIVDNIAPTGDMDAPEIFISTGQQKVNDLYNSSVTLDVSAYDPTAGDLDGRDFYSGIRSVTYRISADDTGAEETGTLLTGATDEFNNVTQRMNSSIVVDGDTFNSNEVSVEVTVIDNSGNANYGTMKLQIDTTNPSVLVTYDNNNGDTEFGDRAYFKEERTAIVDITERNFDESAVEMTINATDGAAPEISGWQQIPGSSANSDDTIYRATVRYYADGDYTFDIAFTDKSGNAAPEETYEGQSPTEFTVDMTNPVISVAYDNNAAVNGNYYNEARTATVTIEEHNFEPGRVVSTLTTEGGTAAVPQLSDWSTAGDTHTATVTYAGDTLYSFDLKYTDMAGNQAEDINVDSFYVDVTAPELSIENVESSQAYKDELVRPSVVYSDQYFDSVEITLTGAEHGSLNIDGMGGYASDENGGSFTFDNIPEDDIYTLSATVVDKAGNQTEQSVEFSVNRDGSTYSLDEETESLNGSYVASAKNVVIREVNPDELIEHKLTLFKNDKTVALTEGSDYSVDVSGGNGQWYQYVYTVYSKNFEDDGVYRLTVHSVDKAGNIAENVIDGKDKEITFGVDATAPNIIMMNLESGTTYPTDNLEAAMAVSDNLKLNSVEVYLDNRLEKSWNIDDIKALRDQNEDFTFYISGDSTGAHNVSVIAIDAAGNEQRNEITDFYVTTNLWIRFYTNPFVLWGTVGGIAIVAAGASFVIFRKRKLKISK